MDIVLITDDFYPNLGGVSHTLMNLYKMVRNKGHSLHVFNPYSKGENIYKTITFLEDYTFRDLINSIRSKRFLSLLLLSFWKIFRDKKISLSHRLKIIIYFISNPRILIWVIENNIILSPYLNRINFDIFLGSNLDVLPLLFVLSRNFDKKIVILAHGIDFLIPHSIIFKSLYFKTYLIRNIEKIILSNNIMKKLIKNIHHLDENKLEVIYRGINPRESEVKETREEIRKEFNIPDNQFVLLSVGRHISRKKFDLVIKAVREIKTLRPSLNIKYFLIGEGEQTPFLRQLTKNLNLEKEVEFLGPISIEKRNKFYKLSDIFLMPVNPNRDDIEGFGIVFLEANYYRVPVIGTATGGILEAIQNKKTGFLIKPHDINDLINKILFLHDNESIKKEMGEKGYSRVINEYTWDKIVMDYIKVFKNVI